MTGIGVLLGTRPLSVVQGPVLLSGLEAGPSLAAHRMRFAPPVAVPVRHAVDELEASGLRGRGGAGFPFARKLATAARRGATVVVNLSEGEPASFKDAVLAVTRPHLILDGALWAALAIGAKTVHIVLPGEHPDVAHAMDRALAERRDRGLRWRTHVAGTQFVAGQASAVIELISGRENAPVTTWQPEAVAGYKGRPTLLSNAETFAHAAVILAGGSPPYRRFGTPEEPGTMLLTVHGDGPRPTVVEVPFGTPWADILHADDLAGPVLLGGFHGSWVDGTRLAASRLTRADAAALGASLGAGIVLPQGRGRCPVEVTASIVAYLASESARRCGPCRNGLPALADAVAALASGRDTRPRLDELCGVLPGRGACAHPDGTVRLVASLRRSFMTEVDAHAHGRCQAAASLVTR